MAEDRFLRSRARRIFSPRSFSCATSFGADKAVFFGIMSNIIYFIITFVNYIRHYKTHVGPRSTDPLRSHGPKEKLQPRAIHYFGYHTRTRRMKAGELLVDSNTFHTIGFFAPQVSGITMGTSSPPKEFRPASRIALLYDEWML